MKDRAETLEQLAESALLFYGESRLDSALLERHMSAEVRGALQEFRQSLESLGDWSADSINGLVQGILKRHRLKMAAFAVPVRLIVFGVTQTPALSPALAVAGRERVLERLRQLS